MPVSTSAKPDVRSFSQRLAFSIRNISMNRKPRPSAGKYTSGRSSPASHRCAVRASATRGTSSTTSAITTACASTARLTSAPISAWGRISSRFRIVSS